MTILVVEDEASIREVEVAYLTEAGYTVIEATDGPRAVAIFRQESPDLVVLDLNLPGMDGLDVCQAMRRDTTVPILMVTARNGDEDEVKGLEIGADDYIRKPFNPNILVARVNTLLRRQASKQLHFEGLTIDPKTMTVIKDGKKVSLTTTRFKLLLALASQPNVVFSRSQLVDQIYDDVSDHFVYDRTIDAHIKTLRQEIETDPRSPRYIETVIGSGYRFRGTA